jgi:four helix bundle protein
MERTTNRTAALFDHEKLEVYQRCLGFVAWLEPVLRGLPKTLPMRDQLDRASTSMLLNLAEGNGKFTDADRCRFFDTARGSALECAAGLDLLRVRGKCTAEVAWAGKQTLQQIVAMLVGLIKANSNYRVHDGP